MKELTSGRPVKLIIGFALPVLLGLAFQQAYTLTDTIIIGRQLGENSLAAVGSTSAVVSLMFNIINGLVTGFAIIIAKNFGAGDHDEMRRSIARTMTFSGIAAAAIILGIAFFIDPLLHALDTPEGIFDEARTYLFIVDLGLAATLFYNLESAILRAVGDSVIPLIILVISTVINIGLDLLMVVALDMGVAGAAMATVIAQLVSAVVCLIYLIRKRPFLIVKPRDFRFTAASTAELLSAGCGMALMYSIVDIGSSPERNKRLRRGYNRRTHRCAQAVRIYDNAVFGAERDFSHLHQPEPRRREILPYRQGSALGRADRTCVRRCGRAAYLHLRQVDGGNDPAGLRPGGHRYRSALS